MKLLIKKGVTSKLLRIFIQNNSVTTGAGLTGLVFGSGSLSAYYIREGDASPTAITLATMTVGIWATGGFKEVDATNMPGLYEIGIPNAVLASGANSVVVMLKGAANMATVVIEIQLVDVDLQDTVRFGLTALPNAAAEAAGGLYTRGTGAGQINQPVNGRIDVNSIGNIINSGTAQAGAIASITLATGASATDGQYDPALIRIVTGTGAGQARLIIQYVGATRIAYVDRDWRVAPDATSTYEVVSSPNIISTNEGLAQGGTSNTITLNASASSIDNTYNGQVVVLRTGTGQDQSRIITSYVGATKVATLAEAWLTIPTSTTGYILWPLGRALVSAMVSGVITSTVIAADAIGASQLATDAIGSAELSAAAVTKIQAGLSTYAGGDTSGTTTLLSRIPGTIQPQTGDSYSRLGANGAGLTAIGDTRLANLDTPTSSRAPSATALSTAQWTNTRAGNLDNLDVAASSRLPTSSYVAPDNAGISTIQTNQTTINSNVLTRAPASTAVSNVDLTPTRSAKLDNLDATISSRSTLTAANVWAFVIEGALTAQGVFRLILASVANKLSGAATPTIKIRDLADTKDRITATVDADGNRSNVTVDAS